MEGRNWNHVGQIKLYSLLQLLLEFQYALSPFSKSAFSFELAWLHHKFAGKSSKH